MSQDENRRRALDCIAVARLVKDPDHATLLLGMAKAWFKLAEIVAVAKQTKEDHGE